MATDQATLKAQPKNEPPPRGFQSAEAKVAAMTPAGTSEDSDPPKPAAVSSGDGAPKVAVRVEDELRLVKVRPRQTIPRTRIGGQWYSFTAGKECLVPKHVERLLAEKNIL